MSLQVRYKIMRRVERIGKKARISYGVHEVFFKGKAKSSWTKDPIFGYFDNIEELKTEMKRMMDEIKDGEILDYHAMPDGHIKFGDSSDAETD